MLFLCNIANCLTSPSGTESSIVKKKLGVVVQCFLRQTSATSVILKSAVRVGCSAGRLSTKMTGHVIRSGGEFQQMLAEIKTDGEEMFYCHGGKCELQNSIRFRLTRLEELEYRQKTHLWLH